MSSALPFTLLLYTLAFARCHKDSATSGGEPIGNNVAPTGSASASPVMSTTEVGDGVAPAASALGGDEASAPTSDVGRTLNMGPGRQGKMSTSFSGVYVCSGSQLKLSTHGNIVKGTLRDPTGSTHGEVTCIVRGSQCEGRAVDFSIGGGPPALARDVGHPRGMTGSARVSSGASPEFFALPTQMFMRA